MMYATELENFRRWQLGLKLFSVCCDEGSEEDALDVACDQEDLCQEVIDVLRQNPKTNKTNLSTSSARPLQDANSTNKTL